jgi:hypothetical protein
MVFTFENIDDLLQRKTDALLALGFLLDPKRIFSDNKDALGLIIVVVQTHFCRIDQR